MPLVLSEALSEGGVAAMEARTPTALFTRGRRGTLPRDSTPALFVIKGRGIAYGSCGVPDYVCNLAQGQVCVCEWAANMRSALRTARRIKAVVNLVGPNSEVVAEA